MFQQPDEEKQNNIQISEEEKRKIEISKMFNLSEKILMNYICYYMEKQPFEIFKDNEIYNKINTEELFIYPIEEYKVDTYLSFKLCIVPHNYVSKIPSEILTSENGKTALSFIIHSVYEVFDAIIKNGINLEYIQEVNDNSFHLEFDENTLTFLPVYIYPVRRNKFIMQDCKDKLENFYNENKNNGSWENFPQQVRSDWTNQYSQVVNYLENLFVPDKIADKKELEKNTELKKYKKIGIMFKEII